MTDKWLCPVCGGTMKESGGSHRCSSGHCYDIARSGYVNLIRSNKSLHGDDREMIRARHRFLESGYYEALREALCRTLGEALTGIGSPVCLDAGCGECYYTARLHSTVGGEMLGIDLSRDALMIGAKRNAGLELAVASVNALPLGDGSADAVISVFAPLAAGEFHRVLRRGGKLIRVIPLARHLWEMKEILYAQPYENREDADPPEGFVQVSFSRVEYTARIEGGAINDLFAMTPYYYRTGSEGREKLAGLSSLTTTVAFGILTYEKSRRATERLI